MKKSLLIISLLIFSISSNSFGDNQWVSIGPEGGPINALAIDPQTPDTLYAGTEGGAIFKSTNGGASWTAKSIQLTNASIYALAIHPQTSDTLYAGTLVGIYKSTSGGTNWTDINTGLNYGIFFSLAINPQTPDTIFVAGSGGVFKSTNGGEDWTVVNTGIPTYTFVWALAINPQTPDTLYVGTWGGGVFKTTNGGMNWTAINTGLTSTYAETLAINPQTPETLYAGCWDGVFKSTDGGANWTAVNTGLPTDTWIWALAINPQTPETLYAGCWDGVFKSTNGGANWNNTGLTYSYVFALAINPQTPDILYAGTRGGVFKIEHAYEPTKPTLTVLKSGTGSGTVTSSPAGIDCGSDCSESYDQVTSVTLNATPASGSTFTGWSDGGCSGTGTCVVVMDADIEVTAAFSAKSLSISVSPDSLDFGIVTVWKKITKTLKITNNGSKTLIITISGLEGTDFSIQGSSSVTIKAKKSHSLKVVCTPTQGGVKTAILEIQTSESDTAPLEVSLTATLPATTPDILVGQTPIEFGSIKVGKKVTKTLKIANNGSGDLMITLSGLEETDFGIQGSSSVTIKAKKSYSLKVLFTPKSAGLETATLSIISNDPDTPTLEISLSGTGQ